MRIKLMLRYSVVLLALVLLTALRSVLLLPPHTTHAQDEPIFALVAANNVNVYVGPDFAYRVVGQLPRNTSVEVIGRTGDFFNNWDGRQWLQIQYGSGAGWVYGRYLRTGRSFNNVPPTGRILPRTADGRVPEVFDLSRNICDTWQGNFGQSGNFMAGDAVMNVSYPTMPGATVYTVIAISPSGFRTPFDSVEGSVEIRLDRLPFEGGTYTWRVAPYWTESMNRNQRQQICLLWTGGMFDKPDTTPPTATPRP
jgi:hypothetical protein